MWGFLQLTQTKLPPPPLTPAAQRYRRRISSGGRREGDRVRGTKQRRSHLHPQTPGQPISERPRGRVAPRRASRSAGKAPGITQEARGGQDGRLGRRRSRSPGRPARHGWAGPRPAASPQHATHPAPGGERTARARRRSQAAQPSTPQAADKARTTARKPPPEVIRDPALRTSGNALGAPGADSLSVVWTSGQWAGVGGVGIWAAAQRGPAGGRLAGPRTSPAARLASGKSRVVGVSQTLVIVP